MKAALSAVAGGLVVAGVLSVTATSPPSDAVTLTGDAAPAAATVGAPPTVAGCVTTAGGELAGLSVEQRGIAKVGVDAANRAKLGEPAARIIVAAGIVESGLRNLSHGDRDSLGWLQQRPSQGWKHATDPARAADDFLAALKRVPGWASMEPGDAAQAVQRSGFPDRYTQVMPRATQIVAGITGQGCADPAPSAGRVSGRAGTVLAWARGQVGKAYVMGANGPNAWDCSSFSRTAMQQAGVTGMPRTAQAQRDWCASGRCKRIPDGQERPGDLVFWDSYLGPSQVGHVAIIRDPAARGTTDARGSKQGVINGTYPLAASKHIFEVWRPNGLT